WIMRYATRGTTDVSPRYETPGLYPNVVPPVTPSPLHVIAVSWLHSPPDDPTLPRREPGARRAGREGDDDARAVPAVAQRGRERRQPEEQPGPGHHHGRRRRVRGAGGPAGQGAGRPSRHGRQPREQVPPPGRRAASRPGGGAGDPRRAAAPRPADAGRAARPRFAHAPAGVAGRGQKHVAGDDRAGG